MLSIAMIFALNVKMTNMTYAETSLSGTLKIIPEDLPNGISYSVREEDYSSECYTTTKTDKTDTVK